ncbi:YbdD/YjiX family protein [Micrococcus aloeverae]
MVAPRTTPGGAPAAEASPARRTWQAVRWWVRQLSGEGRYDAYVAHHRVHHPERAPMTEREFWRAEYARQEENPGSRCC